MNSASRGVPSAHQDGEDLPPHQTNIAPFSAPALPPLTVPRSLAVLFPDRSGENSNDDDDSNKNAENGGKSGGDAADSARGGMKKTHSPRGTSSNTNATAVPRLRLADSPSRVLFSTLFYDHVSFFIPFCRGQRLTNSRVSRFGWVDGCGGTERRGKARHGRKSPHFVDSTGAPDTFID